MVSHSQIQLDRAGTGHQDIIMMHELLSPLPSTGPGVPGPGPGPGAAWSPGPGPNPKPGRGGAAPDPGQAPLTIPGGRRHRRPARPSPGPYPSEVMEMLSHVPSLMQHFSSYDCNECLEDTMNPR